MPPMNPEEIRRLHAERDRLLQVNSAVPSKSPSSTSSEIIRLEQEIKDLKAAIATLKGRCLSEIDSARWCEEVYKQKGDWCEMCRLLNRIGISQVEKE